ncbi:hypothetical protein GW17_00031258, partial [Ensete ventricosum]
SHSAGDSMHAPSYMQPSPFGAVAVNVPNNNSFNIVTVRCGLCANILYVNLEALLGKLPLQNLQVNTPPHFGL